MEISRLQTLLGLFKQEICDQRNIFKDDPYTKDRCDAEGIIVETFSNVKDGSSFLRVDMKLRNNNDKLKFIEDVEISCWYLFGDGVWYNGEIEFHYCGNSCDMVASQKTLSLKLKHQSRVFLDGLNNNLGEIMQMCKLLSDNEEE